MRNPSTHERGFGMIETILVLVVFTGIGALVGIISLHLKDDVRAELDRVQALALAQEGIHALYTLRDIDIDSLEAGTHGLTFSMNAWELSDTPDTEGKFTRTLTITRGVGDIVIATSSVAWGGVRGDTVELTTTLYDIFETFGASEFLVPDFSTTLWNTSQNELYNIVLTNTDSVPHDILAIMCSWQGSALLTELHIGSSTVFSTATSSALSSGSRIIVEDFTLLPQSEHSMRIVFSEPGIGTRNTLQIELEDGSVRNSSYIID